MKNLMKYNLRSEVFSDVKKQEEVCIMRKFISYALVLAVFMALTPISSAQQKNKEDAPKIGYVDLQRVIIDSKAGQSARSALEAKFRKKEGIIEQESTRLNKRKQDFEKRLPQLSESKRKEEAEQIYKQEKKLRRTSEDFREELQKESGELEIKIKKDIKEIVEKTAKSEGFDMIMEWTETKNKTINESGVIYARPQMDITDKIIEAYDKKQ